MSDQLAVARLIVARDRPYYAAVLWALQPVPVKDFAKNAPGPMGVDQHLRLYYDPDTIGEWSTETIAAVLCHEVGHVLRAHTRRCGERDPLLWNIAGDLEINDDLVAEKIPGLPAWIAVPAMFKLPNGLLAEEYYDQLPVKKVTVTGVGGGGCGSVSNGKPQAGDKPADGDGATAPGVSDAEQELIRMRVAQDVQAHAKSRGTVPGWLERWANERLKTKVDWRRLLAAYIRRACGDARGAVDFTYARPSRRSAALPQFVLPALRQPTPQIAVVVDTSGSMSERELSQALAEIAGVLEAGGHRNGVTVLSVDAAVHTSQKVFRPDQVKLAGGGGTDMSLGVEAAAKLRPRPHAVICVTDGETPWPATALPVPLIIARTQKASGCPAPPWAKVVDVTPDTPAKS